MRHRSIKALYEYWDALRGNRKAPDRMDINPRGIAGLLGDVFLLDSAEADFRFRLAGSRLVSALARPLTNARFDEIWLPESYAAARSILRSVTEDGEPVLVGIRIPEPMPETVAPDHPPMIDRKTTWPLPSWPNLRRVNPAERKQDRDPAFRAGELILLPLAHPARTAHGTGFAANSRLKHSPNGRILGALGLFEQPAMPATSPQSLSISGTRFLHTQARPAAGPGLLAQQEAASIIRRHGHLVLMRGDLTEVEKAPPRN
jgi:hypothetical protein